jgi:tetratricopeptide (TPR) repeat protein
MLAPSPRPLAAGPCERTLWGCPPSAPKKDTAKEPQARYEQLCTRGRRALRFTQTSATRDLAEAVTDLSEAVQLVPEQAEGWALLGAVLLEQGHYSEAEPILRRAESTGEELPAGTGGAALAPKGGAGGGLAGARLGTLASLDPQLETLVVTGLAFTQALRGDLSGALERSRRLLLRRGLSHRALWRVGELLMATGKLEEATAIFERACTLPRGAFTTTLEVARACHGLLVALDRGERARAAFILRRATSLDFDHRALEMADLYPPYDREYYRALTLPPGCARRAALGAYLREARPQPSVPGAYLRRAEEHLQADNNQSCTSDL